MKMLIAASLIFAAPLAFSSPAMAATATVAIDEAVALSAGGYVWRDRGVGAPLSIVVSLPDQRAYVYRGDVLVAVSTVSTGRQGHDTPVGSFPILEKQVAHKSTLYDDAPMPFMQRLTWDGVALHAGGTPGFPASHGCVHLPTAFAKKLFGATRVGTQVTVIDASIDGAPVDLTPPAPVDTEEETASANAGQLAMIDRP